MTSAAALRAQRGGAGMSRRRFLAAVGVAGTGVAADAFWVEPNRLTVTRHAVAPPAGGPTPGPTVRLVQLADLHLQRVGRHERRIAGAVRTLAPSLILLTGDAIDRADRLGTLDAFLGLLDAGTPKYAVLGNWEYFSGVGRLALERVYGRHGCRLLVNESVVHRHAGADLLITGLDDLLAGQPSLGASLRGHAPLAHHVVLAHCPLQRDYLRGRLPARPWMASPPPPEPDGAALVAHAPRLVLSGHTHGGQVNLLGYCPWRPWGSGPYVSGWYASRDPGRAPDLYVSRGLGTADLPARFGASPELPCFDWHLAAPSLAAEWRGAVQAA